MQFILRGFKLWRSISLEEDKMLFVFAAAVYFLHTFLKFRQATRVILRYKKKSACVADEITKVGARIDQIHYTKYAIYRTFLEMYINDFKRYIRISQQIAMHLACRCPQYSMHWLSLLLLFFILAAVNDNLPKWTNMVIL